MGIGHIFNVLLINPIFNILLVFIFVLTTLHIPGSLGWAIIALTTLFRFAFNPFYKKQAEMAVHMEELRPKIEALQKKYKKEPQKLQQEQLKLYQERGINPASGCLVGLIQLPIILALYQVLLQFFQTDIKDIGAFLEKVAYADFLRDLPIDPHFLGFNLSVTPSQYQHYGYIYLLIPIITAALQYLQVVKAMPQKKEDPEAAKKKTKEEIKAEQESFQSVFQKQMKVMFPVMIGYFSYILPVGLALYWNVFSLFSIVQAMKAKKQ
jgi:YidC/Oxa1 family membrane protein insertase